MPTTRIISIIMKNLRIILFILGVLLLTSQIIIQTRASYCFEKDYLQLWHLADKSSTIEAKQKYINQFVTALENGYEKGEFSSHDAVFLKTPNNQFRSNLDAVKTLAKRLNEIQELNPNSFEYNTAIQQITAQEQGEAKALIGVITGCYELKIYPMVWCWIGVILCIIDVVFICIPCAVWIDDMV